MRTLLQTIRVLPFDESCAPAAADIRAQLEQAGQPIGPLDTLIGATVLAHSATLVTPRTGEFSRVPGLALVDWF